MGCDIHIHVEVRSSDGEWVHACRQIPDKYSPGGMTCDPVYDGRNYDLFAILADVRNGYGFAGIKTGEGFVPISRPKGLPTDTKLSEENDDLGEHSFSWLTLAELEGYDWDQVTAKQGWVDSAGFRKWAEEGRPTTHCGMVGGPGVVHMSTDEMRAFVAANPKDNSRDHYALVRWLSTYRDATGSFLTETIPALRLLGAPDNVRVVFGFDS